jgi:sulfoxide reductase catalytic subunit YedY
MPQAKGIAPHVRIGRSRWFNLLWLLPIGFVALIVAVAAAKGLRHTASVERFITQYPGTVDTSSATTNPGFPAWIGIQHFFNLFLMIFIIGSGLQILADHTRLYWTRHSTPGKDWFRVQKPVARDPLWTAKQDTIIKQVKWTKAVEFVADFTDIGGGYNQDHEFFGYRQSI